MLREKDGEIPDTASINKAYDVDYFFLLIVLSWADVTPEVWGALTPQSVAQTSNISIPWELVRKAAFSAPHRTTNRPAQLQDPQVFPGPIRV